MKSLIIGIIILFVVSSVSPMVIGYHDIKEPSFDKTINEIDFLDRYNKYGVSELLPGGLPDNDGTTPSFIESEQEEPSDAVSSTSDSPWPQQGYNAQHLGRSPYSTENTFGVEKWRFAAGDWTDGSPVIANDGTIYFGSSDHYLYAVNPNGTLKWKFYADRSIGAYGISPAIADDGTIYLSQTYGGKWLYALYPNGTKKWKCQTGEIFTSITIDDDGVLYYGLENHLEARDSLSPSLPISKI